MSPPLAPEPLPGARLLFSLDPAVTYLNHGGVGVVPILVQRAQQRLRDEMEANPVRFFSRGLDERIGHARRHLAGALHADPEHTALVPNTTSGIAIVLDSLGLGRDDEVITTDHGFGPVDLAVARAGVRHTVLPVPLAAGDDAIVAALRDRVRAIRPQLVIADLIASPTARLFPVERIAAVLREVGVPLLVDGAHGPGSLDLRIGDLGADFFVGNLHKWGYAPRGTAVLTVAPRWRSRMRAPVVSWSEPAGFPKSVEMAGTRDYTNWLAAPTGLYVLRTLGPDRVRAHNADLARYGQHVLARALGLPEEQVPDPGGPVPMRVLPLPVPAGTDAHALQLRIADELGTEVAVKSWRDGLLLRVSAQVYNAPEEYERLAEGLPTVLKSVR